MADKPAFDPNKPYEISKVEKPAFDASKPYEFAPNQGDQPSKAEDFFTSMREGIPGAGLVHKAERGLSALIYPNLPGNKYTGKSVSDTYDLMKQEDVAKEHALQERSPVISTAGNLVGAVASGNPSSLVGRFGINMADAATRGETLDEAKKNATTAGLVTAGLETLPYVGKLVKPIRNFAEGISKPIANEAEHLAVKATGATGVQSQKFADNAGRELLDQGVVGWFSSPKDIAGKTGTKLEEAWGHIDNSLKALDEKGGSLTKEDLLSKVDEEITSLKGDFGDKDIRKKLVDYRDEIAAGPDNYSLSKAEQIKRKLQRQANYDKDIVSQDAIKKMASITQNLVEEKATALDPQIAKKFTDGKKQWGLFAPIDTAAAKRGATLNQSPLGGLLDTSAFTAGALINHDNPTLGGIPVAIARRIVAPRAAALGANALNAVSKPLPKSYEGLGLPIQRAITRGLTLPNQSQGLKLPGSK